MTNGLAIIEANGPTASDCSAAADIRRFNENRTASFTGAEACNASFRSVDAGHHVPTAVTFTFAPTLIVASNFMSSSALAKILHGLASRISPPLLMGVRPKPSAIAGPAGQ